MRIKSFFTVFTFLIIGYGCLSKRKSENVKPNILFILVDDLGWADLGYTGSQFYETPNVDNPGPFGYGFYRCLRSKSDMFSVMSCYFEREISCPSQPDGLNPGEPALRPA
jgi:hypothetical protein